MMPQKVEQKPEAEPARVEAISKDSIPKSEEFRIDVNLLDERGDRYLEEQMNLAIRKCVEDCQRRAGIGKGRKVTITLEFKPVPRKDARPGVDKVAVVTDVTTKMPAPYFEPMQLPVRVERNGGVEVVTARVVPPTQAQDFLNE